MVIRAIGISASLCASAFLAFGSVNAQAAEISYKDNMAPRYADGFCTIKTADYNPNCEMISLEVRTERKGRTLFNVASPTIGVFGHNSYQAKIEFRSGKARIANSGNKRFWYKIVYNRD